MVAWGRPTSTRPNRNLCLQLTIPGAFSRRAPILPATLVGLSPARSPWRWLWTLHSTKTSQPVAKPSTAFYYAMRTPAISVQSQTSPSTQRILPSASRCSLNGQATAAGCYSVGGVCMHIEWTSVYGCLERWTHELRSKCDFC